MVVPQDLPSMDTYPPASGLETASARALRIPELLSMILANVQYLYTHSNDKSILACLQVNSLWLQEGARCLWWYCGGPRSDYYLPQPSIQQLLSAPSDRQALYAASIRHLYVNIERIQVKSGDGYQTLVRWHGYNLDPLCFPRLEKLSVHLIPHVNPDGHTDFESLIDPWRIKLLKLQYSAKIDFLPVSTDMFCPVSYRCVGLHRAIVKVQNGNPTVWSQRAIQDQLQDDLYRLTHRCPTSILSKDTFSRLYLQSTLKSLDIFGISNEMMKEFGIDHPRDDGFLSQLLELKTVISDTNLKQLRLHLPRLKILSVRPSWRSTRTCSVIAEANLKHLMRLRLDLAPEESVSGRDDLLRIATNSPNLHTVCIKGAFREETGDSDCFQPPISPSIQHLDDNTMLKIARRMPHLEWIELEFLESKLMESTLITMGRYCPWLRVCVLPMYINSTQLVETAELGIWPILRVLIATDFKKVFNMDLPRRSHYEKWVQKLSHLMPALQLLILGDKYVQTDEFLRARAQDDGELIS